MTRMRVSTTVDGGLLDRARGLEDWPNDATMMDAALDALTSRYREAEIDTAYEAYDRLPMDEPDEWGDLASFHDANRLHRQELGSTGGERRERQDGG
ncbi:MAG: antitoxin MazE5 [Acidimicrobiaceae bacterium]|nr:antitoxin MazE5 [Acidimicrobiaceae bacterium]